jgi:peptidoglycan/xylan/chitin deacetylase (PgdA/CDA1 family)
MNGQRFLYESFHRPRRYVANLFDEPAIVLLYHRVTNLPVDSQQLSVTPGNFYFQVDYLKKNYSLLRIDEFVHLLTGKKKFPKRSVILTFDDGYRDNHTEARPILESLNVQALFFITTSLLGTKKELWWDDLERIMVLNDSNPPSLTLAIHNRKYHFATATKDERERSYTALHPIIKYLTPSSRDQVFDFLYSWGGVQAAGRETHRLMSHDDVVQFSRSPSVVLGAHTHTHTPLSILPKNEQRSEMQTSRTILESLTKSPIRYFSYPFGLKKDYTRDTMRIAKELGYEMVWSNYEDQVHRWTSRFEVPRYIVRNVSPQTFQKQIRRHFLC